MQKWRPFFRVVGVVLALAAAQGLIVLAYRWVGQRRGATQGPAFRYERLSGRPAPDLLLHRADGSSWRLADLRGKSVLLHFWATWCPPCKEELPGLLELGRELARDEQFAMVAVTLDEDWAKVRSFFGGEIPSEVFQDQGGHSTKTYDLSTLPDTYLVATDGTLLLRFGGARNWRTRAARDLLERHIHGHGSNLGSR